MNDVWNQAVTVSHKQLHEFTALVSCNLVSALRSAPGQSYDVADQMN